MDNNIYLLSDKNMFLLNMSYRFFKVDNSKVLNIDDNIHNMLNTPFIVSKNMNIKYFLKVVEYDNINKREIDFDTLISTNINLVDYLTENFTVYTSEYDNYFNKSKIVKDQIWYYFYFKKNIDILMLIVSFYKIQNTGLLNFIGNEKDPEMFIKQLKNYFSFLFGKYNIILDELEPFYKIAKYVFLNNNDKILYLDQLINIFEKYDFMFQFINLLLNAFVEVYIIRDIDGRKCVYMDDLLFNTFLIFFYSRIYIIKLMKIFDTVKFDVLHEIIFFKKLYFYSMTDIKIYEYLAIYNFINENFKYTVRTQPLSYDFDFLDDKIVMIKYKNEIYNNDSLLKYIKNKYTFSPL